MRRTTSNPRAKQVSVQLPPDLADRIDAVRTAGVVESSEAETLRVIITAGLPIVEGAAGLARSASKGKKP